MASHSSTLAQKIPWMEEPGRLQSMGSLESDTTERLHFHFSLSCIGEGNGNPFQCSCLENPRDGKPGGLPSMGLHSQTRLKRRSSSNSLNYQVKENQTISGHIGRCGAVSVRTLILCLWSSVTMVLNFHILLADTCQNLQHCFDNQMPREWGVCVGRHMKHSVPCFLKS